MEMHRIITLLSFSLLSFSCSSGAEEVQIHSLNSAWNKKKAEKFEFNIEDSQVAKNIIFVVRNNNTYPYSNLRLLVNFSATGTKTDTLNYIMAKPNGAWLGKGFGETKEILFQYKMNYRFPKNGNYTISVLQAMRNDHLPGIEDLGIKIETAKP